MSVFAILKRNIKWRFYHGITIVMTILQPMLWLVLYSVMARGTMESTGIENYTAFVLPGLIVLVSFSACSSSGMMNYMTKRDGSFYRILAAPIPRSAILMGQLLEGVCCALLETVILGTVSLLLGVRIAADGAGIMVLLLLVILTAFLTAGFACGMSLLLPDEAAYEAFMNAVVLPLFFLSGALFPAGGTKGTLRIVIACNPFTYVIRALRALIMNGAIGKTALCHALLLLIVPGGLVYLWALHRLEKTSPVFL